MGKILIIDVYGALADYEANLPNLELKAIKMARQNGHRDYISTGRSKAKAYHSIRKMKITNEDMQYYYKD